MSAARHLLAGCAVLAAGAMEASDSPPASRETVNLQVIGLPENHLEFELNWKRMAVESLGPDWSDRTAAERSEFADLMFELIAQAYDRLMHRLRDRQVEMTGEEKRPDGLIVRKFTARSRKDPADTVQFSLTFSVKDGVWTAQDFATEDVSLIRVYRSQFRRILLNEGYAVLIAKMKAKIERDRAVAP